MTKPGWYEVIRGKGTVPLKISKRQIKETALGAYKEMTNSPNKPNLDEMRSKVEELRRDGMPESQLAVMEEVIRLFEQTHQS